MRVPATLAVIPLVAGVIAGLILADGRGPDLAWPAAWGGSIALLAAAGAFSLGDDWVAIGATVVGCVLTGVSLAVTASGAAYHPPLLRWFESRTLVAAASPVTIEGTLREDAAWLGESAALVVDVERLILPDDRGGAQAIRTSGGLRLSVGGTLTPRRLAEWRSGRRIRAPAFLRLPGVYLDPGVRDDRRALARRGIVLVGNAKSALLVDVVQRGSTMGEWAGAARAWIRGTLSDAVGVWSARSAGIATAVLIGDRSALPDADTRRLQDAGTYHVIAISGGNIAILTMILLGVFGLAGVPARVAAAGTVALLLAYRELVVSAPSVERAIAAAILYLAARVIDQHGPALNVLAVAALAGLAWSPVVLLDAGFLLSFGATLGILLAASARSPPPPARTLFLRACHDIRSMVWTTMAAEAALWPVSALLFGRVTAAGLALNLIAIPLMSVLQAMAMLALALAEASIAAARACGYVAHLAARGILESAWLAELVPGVARDVALPAAWLVVTYYAAAVGVLIARTPCHRRAASGGLIAAATIMVIGPGWAADTMAGPATGLRVAVFDVGQGDATAIVWPDGRAVLVDAGGVAGAVQQVEDEGGFDVGQRVVVPALRALGVIRLEALTITHGDPDHLGGVPAVLRSWRPGSIWDGVPVPAHAPLRLVNDLADALRIPWRTVQAGDVTRVGQATLRVLHPPLPDWERQRVRNDDSVVLDVRIGDVSIVLPGDIGAEGEQAIIPLLQPARTRILKAAHHGSATSSTPALLDALRPDAVIVSAGRDNRFGHPAASVVARYRERGIPMFSTADSGAVLIDTDGRKTTIRGWADGRTLTLPSALTPEP